MKKREREHLASLAVRRKQYRSKQNVALYYTFRKHTPAANQGKKGMLEQMGKNKSAENVIAKRPPKKNITAPLVKGTISNCVQKKQN
jgi:hypothetical protein